MTKLHLYLLLSVLFTSCGITRKSTKNEVADGYYIERSQNGKQKVYVINRDENLSIYRIGKGELRTQIDTSQTVALYEKGTKANPEQPISLDYGTLDIDFLTIPLKYRPEQFNLPAQLNTNLNGAVYLGYRNDRYVIKYPSDPLGTSNRSLDHYGFSIGFFSGIGNTAVSPTTTNNLQSLEYDGIVFAKGIAGIIAVNNFTVGISVGFDNLIDANRKRWIYEKKLWFGLAFGLNLN